VAVYDAIMEAGKKYQIMPAGLAALDVARIEAGFLMNGVDYFSSNHCVIDSRKSTPYEMGLGWTVNLKRDPFIGQAALKEEKKKGSKWSFVGLDYDWEAYEKLFAIYDLAPETPHGAWRTALPVFNGYGEQVGQATSGAWSPTLKKNLALASIKTDSFKMGDTLKIEATAEYERKTCPVKVCPTMFYNPERKRS
jgi:aminomethyltransferase